MKYKFTINATVLHCSIDLVDMDGYKKCQKLFNEDKKWDDMRIIRAVTDNGGGDNDIECNGHFGNYFYFTCNTEEQAERITKAVSKLLNRTRLSVN